MYSLDDLSKSHKMLLDLRKKNLENESWTFLHYLTKQLEYRILANLIENVNSILSNEDCIEILKSHKYSFS